jgi:hypothetical protein
MEDLMGRHCLFFSRHKPHRGKSKLHFFIFLSLFLFFLTHAHGKTIHVRPDGLTLAQCGSVALPCALIQDALDKAEDGDLIKIAAGEYLSNFSLTTQITDLVLQCGWTNDFSSRSPHPENTSLRSQRYQDAVFFVDVGLWQVTA